MKNFLFAVPGGIAVLISLIATRMLFLADFDEGFAGDDAYLVPGKYLETVLTLPDLQARAKALQVARMDAERRFMEHCGCYLIRNSSPFQRVIEIKLSS